MVSGISNVNSLELLRASKAFQYASKPSQIEESENFEDISDIVQLDSVNKEFKSESVDLAEKTAERNFKINEIKDFALNKQGLEVSEDDIKYGLTYGRSVLVDYSA